MIIKKVTNRAFMINLVKLKFKGEMNKYTNNKFKSSLFVISRLIEDIEELRKLNNQLKLKNK